MNKREKENTKDTTKRINNLYISFLVKIFSIAFLLVALFLNQLNFFVLNII